MTGAVMLPGVGGECRARWPLHPVHAKRHDVVSIRLSEDNRIVSERDSVTGL